MLPNFSTATVVKHLASVELAGPVVSEPTPFDSEPTGSHTGDAGRSDKNDRSAEFSSSGFSSMTE